MKNRDKIGFFPGVWDLLHPGHIRAIKKAKSKCDYLMIGVNARPNKRKPILNVKERVELLKAIKWVDDIWIYQNDKALYNRDKEPSGFHDIRFMGADHKKIHHKINAKIVKISRNHNYSTSNLRKQVYEAEKSLRH